MADKAIEEIQKCFPDMVLSPREEELIRIAYGHGYMNGRSVKDKE